MFKFMTRSCLQKQFLMGQNRAKMAKEGKFRGSVGSESSAPPHLSLSFLFPQSLFHVPSFSRPLSSLLSLLFPFLKSCYSLVYVASFLLVNKLLVSILFFLVYLFIYFWLLWVFIAVHGLSLVAASRGYSSLQCMGFSLRWLLLLRSTGSRCTGFSSCGSRALECRLSNCGARA